MEINYQEYLMQIGASPKLVKMAAVIKGIETLENKPSKDQIAVTDNGDILIMQDKSVTKYQLDGDEVIKESFFIESGLVYTTHINKYGIEYLEGVYRLVPKRNAYFSQERLGSFKIDPSYGYTEREGRLVSSHDSSYAITIQDGDWGEKLEHDGSCFLATIGDKHSRKYNSEEVRDIQLKNMAIMMTRFPTTTGYYLENGYVTNDNLQNSLLEGFSKLIEWYRNFIKENGIANYPWCFDGVLTPKPQEQVDKENEEARLEIVKCEELVRKITNGEKLVDPTDGYTEEIACEIRKRTTRVLENNMIDMINFQKDKNNEAKEKYAHYVEMLKKLSNNLIFRKEAEDIYNRSISEFKREAIGLHTFKSDIRILELYEVLIGARFIGKVYDYACKEIENFFKKYDGRNFKSRYFNKLTEENEKTKTA